MNLQEIYEAYKSHVQKAGRIEQAIAVLQWDQEIHMPPGGAEIRGEQIATLSSVAHEMSTNDKLGGWLEILNEKLGSSGYGSEEQINNVKIALKEFKRKKKYSLDFVENLSKSITASFQSWNKARENKNFKLFESALDRLIQLKKEECEFVGYEEAAYDVLLDEFEPGIKTSTLDGIFGKVKSTLVPFTKEILLKSPPDDSFLHNKFNDSDQWNFTLDILRKIGYDFDKGRQDKSIHPFTTSFGPGDIRITTRINENDISEILWSSIHEGGHALYEQGLPESDYGLPSGTAASLGIHESQSRLYENQLGRSASFWTYFFPKLQHSFKALKNVSFDDFYAGINKISPGFIRTSADELTYHSHVLIRYEIEKAIFRNEVKTSDLPGMWNELYKDYLGLEVKDPNLGILQDVHWSYGSFGYFPTYSLGSFYAAQFYNEALNQNPEMENEFEKGEFDTLLQWLRENVHSKGQQFSSEEICFQATGETLNLKYFMEYARNKWGNIY